MDLPRICKDSLFYIVDQCPLENTKDYRILVTQYDYVCSYDHLSTAYVWLIWDLLQDSNRHHFCKLMFSPSPLNAQTRGVSSWSQKYLGCGNILSIIIATGIFKRAQAAAVVWRQFFRHLFPSSSITFGISSKFSSTLMQLAFVSILDVSCVFWPTVSPCEGELLYWAPILSPLLCPSRSIPHSKSHKWSWDNINVDFASCLSDLYQF